MAMKKSETAQTKDLKEAQPTPSELLHDVELELDRISAAHWLLEEIEYGNLSGLTGSMPVVRDGEFKLRKPGRANRELAGWLRGMCLREIEQALDDTARVLRKRPDQGRAA
jgi:hypothetical protein